MAELASCNSRVCVRAPGVRSVQVPWIKSSHAQNAIQYRGYGGIGLQFLPGEKPDLRKILEEANNLTATDHFEEALQRDLWYHGHAQEFGGSASDYSLLSQWVELGRRYPKAKQALVNIRDKDTREITEGRGYAEIFHEVQAINGELQDDDATYALFNTVRDSDPMLADQCFYYLQDLLVAKGEYQWCLKHLGDPQERFDSIRRGLDMDRDNQKRMAETRQRTAQQMADMNQKERPDKHLVLGTDPRQ